jgi:hypothetical protein
MIFSPVEVVLISAREDRSLRDELLAHLAALTYQGLISTWHDGLLEPGAERDSTIQQRLSAATVIVPLISSDFIASEDCHARQLNAATMCTAAGTAIVLPVIVRACDWRHLELGRLKVLPDNAKAVASWANRDEAWENVALGIRAAICRPPEQGLVSRGASGAHEADSLRPADRGLLDHREMLDRHTGILLESARNIASTMALFNGQTRSLNRRLATMSDEELRRMSNKERLRITNNFVSAMTDMKNALFAQLPSFSQSIQEVFGSMSGITHLLGSLPPSRSRETLEANAAVVEGYRDQLGEAAEALEQYRDSFGLLPKLTYELDAVRQEAVNVLAQLIGNLARARDLANGVLSRTQALLQTAT